MRKICITLPDSVIADLNAIALAQGRKRANLAVALIEVAIEGIKQRGEFPTKKPPE